MEVTGKLLTVLALCVMVCLTAGRPSVDGKLVKMSQASGDVMETLQELQDVMLAEGGFKVDELLPLLDRFCEERNAIDELEQEIESDLSARREKRSDCKWTTKCSYNSRGEWECSVQLEC